MTEYVDVDAVKKKNIFFFKVSLNGCLSSGQVIADDQRKMAAPAQVTTRPGPRRGRTAGTPEEKR